MSNCLTEIRETLDKIEVKVLFRHSWFPAGKFVSILNFYSRVKNAIEIKSESTNIKKFFARQTSPLISSSESNVKNI